MCQLIINPKVCRCSNDTDCPSRVTRPEKEFPGHLAPEINLRAIWFCDEVLPKLAVPAGLGLMTVQVPMDDKGTTIPLDLPDCPNTLGTPVEFTEELYTSPNLCLSCWQSGCNLRQTRPLTDPYWETQAARSNLDSREIREAKMSRSRSASGSSSGSSTVRHSTETIRESKAGSSSRS
ncbi:hypothetical protein CONLIGDRAFT_679046 [Coniochaeta ligniaria NRRL 30616]|uniref:Uncharacterized protein n=1 Tax=Coniochaeta ligniaria NRRL 30616 TaxID=1408157 RepID=A0A1J7JTG6_9PEZI|nr:hypothetical protein CONLIGDRAFT_679046 [Coniochaeta ligniaria NRRL 30616]